MVSRVARAEWAAVGFMFLFGVLASPGLATGQNFIFNLAGDQEVPAVPSPFTGGCMGQLNQVAAEFALACSHNVPGATLMHIHRAPTGSNGPIVFDLGPPASPVQATWTGMTAQNIADLLAGNLYVNIHTGGRPAGIIRGQVLPRTADTFTFFPDGSQQVPPDVSTATGRCFAVLNGAATQLSVDCAHMVTQPTTAHIHIAPTGENGPVLLDFGDPTSPISGVAPLTALNVAELLASFFYVNIHSINSPDGEIRGQIIDMPPMGSDVVMDFGGVFGVFGLFNGYIRVSQLMKCPDEACFIAVSTYLTGYATGSESVQEPTVR